MKNCKISYKKTFLESFRGRDVVGCAVLGAPNDEKANKNNNLEKNAEFCEQNVAGYCRTHLDKYFCEEKGEKSQ